MASTTKTEPSQRDHAYAVLRERLILQQITEGTRLSEPAWARELKVSRTAIRESFARLESEGLIRRATTVGYVVPTLSHDDIREIVELRLALESAAIDAACEQRRTTSTDLAPLVEAADQHVVFVEQKYRLGATEADHRFHSRLVELAGNRRLTEMYRRAPLPLIRGLSASAVPGIRPVEEHRAIIAALSRDNATVARRILKNHLRRAVANPAS